MQLTYVTWPAAIPQQMSFGLLPLGTTFTSPGGLVAQVERAPLWKATVSLQNMDADTSALLNVFLHQMIPAARVVKLTDYGHPQRGSLAGTPLVNGANQTGNTLLTKGWTPNAQGVLKAADGVTLATGQLVRTMTDVNADASGLATITVEPGILKAPADASALTVVQPTAVFYMPQGGIPTTSPPLNSELSFDLLEYRPLP